MRFIHPLKHITYSVVFLLLIASPGFSQIDSTQLDTAKINSQFDSQLLRLNVPDAFQKNSLKLEIFSDSSWQMYRGSEVLGFEEALELLDLSNKLADYDLHLKKEAKYLKEFRSRRVFALITALGGLSYLAIIWDKGWVYQIPGYVATTVAGFRLYESRQLEILALREQYYLHSLVNPSDIKKRVDDYNFKLYQYLSSAGIQFSDS